MNRLSSTLTVILIFVISIGNCFAIDDEPADARGYRYAFWPHIQECTKCFHDFVEFVQSRKKSTERFKDIIPPLPKKFPWIWVEAESFTNIGRWKIGANSQASGKNILLLGYGHSDLFARTVVDIPTSGFYRLWVRYYHIHKYHNTFHLRVRPVRMVNYSFGWQGDIEQYVDRRFSEDDNDPRTGWYWDSCYCFLPEGKVCLELAGSVHRGPFANRQVDLIVVTSDPLSEPDINLRPVELKKQVLEYRSPCLETSKLWKWWCIRPGSKLLAKSVPDELYNLWKNWKCKKIDELAVLKTGQINKGLYLRRLSRFVVFDPRWNLIGTSAQVKTRANEIISKSRQGTKGESKWIEAEDFNILAGWNKRKNTTASKAEVLGTHYCDGLAQAEKTIKLTGKTKYNVWVRYYDLHKYNAVFSVAVTGSGVSKKHIFGKKNVSKQSQWVWQKFPFPAPETGAYKISITKNIGKGPYTFRQIDCLVVTSDLQWQPKGLGKPLLSQVQKKKLLEGYRKVISHPNTNIICWENKNQWTGWNIFDYPTENNFIDEKGIKLNLPTKSVRNICIHITNFSNKRKIIPLVNPEKFIEIRVVTSILSKRFGWQQQLLLSRKKITLPPGITTTLWLTIDGAKLNPQKYETHLVVDNISIPITVTVTRGKKHAKNGYSGGWASPYSGKVYWQDFTDHGLNLVHEVIIPKQQMKQLGIRLCNVTFGDPKGNADKIKMIAKAIQKMGLDYKDWSWEISDEPGDSNASKWAEIAKFIKTVDPNIQMWCNPHEYESCHTQAIKTMQPFIDVFCPFVSHFRKDEHGKLICKIGQIKLFYTTIPCHNEMAPGSPMDMFGLLSLANRFNRDGWDFFCLIHFYESIYGNGPYYNGPWDDLHSRFSAQSVRVYPGSQGPISTRSYEALREAICKYKSQASHRP